MKAWLVTWEWDGDHAKADKKIVTILNSHLSVNTVKIIVEQIYVDNWFSLNERLSYAKNKKTPCPAYVHHGSMIICGDNPYLWAREVENIEIDGDKQESLVWKEIDRSKIFEQVEKLRIKMKSCP